ncbi:MAG TPA: sugar nucleotide-binding protein, partial [Thermomicrobiales bacterium]|nr:sugar nucleotide-binding protein [Thermomicrobiales bacterium]
DAGADVRAVTVWSLLGAYDWHTLVTREEGVYEPGVFDVRGPSPRPTAIAHMVGDLAVKGRHDHPTLAVPGWWHRPDRFHYGRAIGSDVPGPGSDELETRGARPIAIVGEDGPVVSALVFACRERSIPFHVLSGWTALNSDPATVAEQLRTMEAWAVLDGCVRDPVDGAECVSGGCVRCRQDILASATIAAACRQLDIPLLTVSSDLVFDGHRKAPYVESIPVSPIGICHRMRAEHERRILTAHSSTIVVRTGPLFGWEGQLDPISQALRALAKGELFMADDEVRSPTYVPDFTHAALDLLLDSERGIWHLANTGSASWFDLARRGTELAGIDPSRLTSRERHARVASKRRPRRILESERGWLLPELDDALARHVQATWKTMDGMREDLAA